MGQHTVANQGVSTCEACDCAPGLRNTKRSNHRWIEEQLRRAEQALGPTARPTGAGEQHPFPRAWQGPAPGPHGWETDGFQPVPPLGFPRPSTASRLRSRPRCAKRACVPRSFPGRAWPLKPRVAQVFQPAAQLRSGGPSPARAAQTKLG